MPPLVPADFGGRYPSRENANGTFAVLDVPIVGELKKGARSDLPAEFEIDKAWLDAALAKMRAGAAENYFAPFNVNHHGDDKAAERLGFVHPREVRKIRFRGVDMYALFADIDQLSLETASEIARGGLPYLSIEFPKSGPPEVKSLAALTDKPPQFGFPVFTIGSVLPASTPADALPALCFGSWRDAFTAASEPIACFAYSEDSADEKPTPKGGGEDSRDDETKDDETDETDAEDAPEEKPADPAMAELLGLMKKLCAVLMPPDDAAEQNRDPQSGTSGPVGSTKSAPPKKPDAALAAQETTMATPDPETAGKLAALTSDLAKLQKKDSDREAAEATAKLARDAEAALRAEGYHVTADNREDLATFAALGAEALGKFTASFKRNVSKDPPRTHREIAGAPAASGNGALGEVEAAVAKFSQSGTDGAERARRAAQSWQRQKRAGAPVKLSCEAYIAAEFAASQSFAMSPAADDSDDE